VNKDFGYDLSAASRKELIDGALSPQFVNFVADYDFKWVAEAADFPPSFGAAGGYDSVLLLAYATATLGSGAETGEGLAEGLKKLSNPLGPVINTGPKNIPAGFAALRDMGGIDFAGASGPLNFDPATGEAKSDIQIWCLPKSASGAALPSVYSGLFYDALTEQLSGSFGSMCD